MADQHKSDIVMKFVQVGNAPVYAECVLDVNKDDTMMTGFKPQGYDEYSNFFEVQKFGFGFEVKDEDQSKTKVSRADTRLRPGAAGKTGPVQGEFASWRSANDTQATDIIYPLEFQSFRFDRVIDAASPVFFAHCCTSKTFATASLVKRVAAGINKLPVGFMRIDFKDVLITSLSWDDGDMTTEKCEFICRDFRLQYRPQRDDASLGATSEATWNYKRDALPEKT